MKNISVTFFFKFGQVMKELFKDTSYLQLWYPGRRSRATWSLSVAGIMIMRKVFVKLFLICTSGSGGNVI